MEKFIPYAKLSKKEKRRRDTAKRGTWGALNPVTRKPVNSKAYHRAKARRQEPPCFSVCQKTIHKFSDNRAAGELEGVKTRLESNISRKNGCFQPFLAFCTAKCGGFSHRHLVVI